MQINFVKFCIIKGIKILYHCKSIIFVQYANDKLYESVTSYHAWKLQWRKDGRDI